MKTYAHTQTREQCSRGLERDFNGYQYQHVRSEREKNTQVIDEPPIKDHEVQCVFTWIIGETLFSIYVECYLACRQRAAKMTQFIMWSIKTNLTANYL